MTLPRTRSLSATIVPLALVFLLLAGCESNRDSTITTSLFDRNPGALESITINPDSIGISQRFQDDIAETSGLFAGTLEPVEAFTVIRFSRPGQSVIDSLETAVVFLNIANIWGEGTASLTLYPVTAEWDESEDLDTDALLASLGEPIQTITNDPDSLSSLVFDIPGTLIDSWDGDGAFLLRGAPGGTSLARISSDNSTNAPKLKIYQRTAGADIDSTIIQSEEARYAMFTGVSDTAPIISNGNAQGYVLNTGIPVLSTDPTPINRSILTFTLDDHLFVDTGMTVMLYRLTAEFTTIDEAETDLSNTVSVAVSADSTIYGVDISEFVTEWVNFGEPNYGILVKPYTTGTTPDFAVLTPADSLTIIYTILPEVP